MRCGWNDVALLLELTLCWDHEIHIPMSFWWVVCKNSRCWNDLLCLLNYMWVHECDERMNGEYMMLWPLMVLRLVNEFVMTYDIDLNDHNMHAFMNDIACE